MEVNPNSHVSVDPVTLEQTVEFPNQIVPIKIEDGGWSKKDVSRNGTGSRHRTITFTGPLGSCVTDWTCLWEVDRWSGDVIDKSYSEHLTIKCGKKNLLDARAPEIQIAIHIPKIAKATGIHERELYWHFDMSYAQKFIFEGSGGKIFVEFAQTSPVKSLYRHDRYYVKRVGIDKNFGDGFFHHQQFGYKRPSEELTYMDLVRYVSNFTQVPEEEIKLAIPYSEDYCYDHGVTVEIEEDLVVMWKYGVDIAKDMYEKFSYHGSPIHIENRWDRGVVIFDGKTLTHNGLLLQYMGGKKWKISSCDEDSKAVDEVLQHIAAARQSLEQMGDVKSLDCFLEFILRTHDSLNARV